jgi:hypothetical protein
MNINPLKGDLRKVVSANTPDNAHGWAHELACELQMMPEDRIATFLPPNEPMRQVYRRVIRWAKTQTTEEVERALKEVA